MNFAEVTEKIEKSDPLDFGNIFSRSIELFKQVWLQGFITILLTIAAILPFYILFSVPLIAVGITDPEMLKNEDLPPTVLISIIVLLPILILGIMTVSISLNAAFLRICGQKDLNISVKEEYFFYLKKKYLGRTIVLSLMMLGLALLGMLMCGVGMIYLIVPLSLFPAFLAFDDELSAAEIVKSGFKLGNKNWLVIFGLIVLMGILAELGIFLCLVGILFTAMLSKIPVYYMYKDSLGFSTQE